MSEPDYNDIVYRLRNPTFWFFQIVGPKSGATVQGASDAPREAADEIERLRADCAKLETAHGQSMREIDRLRAELAAEQGMNAANRASVVKCNSIIQSLEGKLAEANVRLDDAWRNKDIITDWYDKASAERDALRALLDELLQEAEDIFVCMADATGINRHSYPKVFRRARDALNDASASAKLGGGDE